MKNIYFELSKTCNMNCSYCYVPQYNKNQKKQDDQMLYDSCDLLLEKAKQEGVEIGEIILHGAETFVLEPEVVREVILRLNQPRRMRVQTNGLALTPAYLDRLGDLQDKLGIGFSIDAKSVHNKYRSNSYDTVIQHLTDVQARGYKCAVLSVVSSETIKHLDELSELFNLLDSLKIKAVIKLAHGDGYSLDYEESLIFARWGILTGNWIKMQSFNPEYCMHGQCNSESISEISAVTGDVHVCNKTNNTQGILGNWKTENLADVFEKRDHSFDGSKIGNDCASCVFWEVCYAGCPNDRDADGYALDCWLKHHTYFMLQDKGIYFLDAFYRNYK